MQNEQQLRKQRRDKVHKKQSAVVGLCRTELYAGCNDAEFHLDVFRALPCQNLPNFTPSISTPNDLPPVELSTTDIQRQIVAEWLEIAQ